MNGKKITGGHGGAQQNKKNRNKSVEELPIRWQTQLKHQTTETWHNN